MSHLLSVIWSWAFVAGLAFGALGMRLYLHAKCRWDDRRHPLPGGATHKVPPFARNWFGGLCGVAVVVYILAQTQQTHDETVALTERFGRCTSDLIVAIDNRGNISTGRDDLSEEQRVIFNTIDAHTATLIRLVLNPPPEVVNLSPEQRRAWAANVESDYNTATAPLRARSDEIDRQVSALRKAREASQLPSPRCDGN
ncbi:hypothetical protein I5G59_gp17 [Mycobacterium phage LilMcDreamy]|uniref:Uncharacterized protein n=1 Tax=Mycobacterium phage LilMcDreamy TaxID=2652422 RepID=A0A5P8D6H7_9CAUD|nr:hypothetical protein I5G59_gp17 [Mycobacterium phage LilMcDreamy]QFP94637.1 hypothetical protein SEA_LILMCDREAMY_17 [Mycobacterium phage LilMcDreamy]